MALPLLRHHEDPLPATIARAVRSRGGITIRRARPDDGPEIDRLARLLDRRSPDGEMLVAEVDGTLLAALPVDGGEPVVDPFRATADLVALLSLRAGQLAAAA